MRELWVALFEARRRCCSKVLEARSQQGGYASLEEAIDTALVFLADEITQHDSAKNPDYLAWVEQTRLKIEEGVRAADEGALLEVDDVRTQLRNKVESARAPST